MYISSLSLLLPTMTTQLYCYCGWKNGAEETDLSEWIEEHFLKGTEGDDGMLVRRGSASPMTDSEIGSWIPIMAQHNQLHDDKLYEPT
jgi:hypothetical protein